MNKKLILTSITALTVGGLILGGGAIALSSVNAQANSSSQLTIFEKIISKLGLNTTADKLQTAFQDAKQEVHQDQVNTDLATAVSSGKLTQAQSDLVKKIETWMLTNKDTYLPKPTQGSNTSRPTQAEIQAMRTQIDAKRTEMMNKMFTDLGITQNDFDNLKTALRNAGLRPGFDMDMGVRGVMMGRKGGRMGRGDFDGQKPTTNSNTSTKTARQ